MLDTIDALRFDRLAGDASRALDLTCLSTVARFASRAKREQKPNGLVWRAAGQRFEPARHVDRRAAPTVGNRAQWPQYGRFGARHVHARSRPGPAALAMSALLSRVRAYASTDFDSR